MKEKAIVYAEAFFGENDGKVANGLVRHSEKYEIVGVVDSTKAGLDAGDVLDGEAKGILVFPTINAALEILAVQPECFIYGIAPTHPVLSKNEREVFFLAMEKGLNIVNGLPEFFTDDLEFMDYAVEYGVTITDVRKPLPREELHPFTGKIHLALTPVIAIMGTDCAIGKRTTAMQLVTALREEGLKIAFIATGQTGLLQGAKYGAAIDVLSSGFATGAVEHAILTAEAAEKPDMIIVEGQGALGHPSYTSSAAILKGALPDAIILQHAPNRLNYCTYPEMSLTSLQSEIDLLEAFCGPRVMAITLNHENMSDAELELTIVEYEATYQLPVTDVLKKGCDKLVDKLAVFFPDLSTPAIA
ncbi:MAG: DUF1611 domain-containing protein [Cytophagales bacterium]|nr:DUF1611 domain-containing protein [Cytophagales bacterium]